MSRPAKLGPNDPPRIGPYTTLARLGRGGQGEVYLAADDDGNEVAVKVLRVDWDPSGTLKRNLNRELVNARKVAEFVTAKVLDFDVVGDLPYIVSEYIEGLDLAEHVRENGPLKGGDLQQLAVQALTALEAIHHAGVVHCDFKPANIVLGQGGARVIDFGIAHALDSTHRVGEVAGSFPYMAPEQIANQHLTPAVDLFAWGSTMVFAATGRPAFPGDRREQVFQAILTGAPQLEGVEGPLLTSVRACLRKEPQDRPTATQARRPFFGRSPNRPPAATRPTKPAPQPRTRPAAARPANPAPQPRTRPAPAGPANPAPQPRTRVEHPVTPPVETNTRKAVAALAGSVVATGLVIWAVLGLPDGSEGQPGTASASPSTAVTTPLSLIAEYEAFWPGLRCDPDPLKTGQQIREKCSLTSSIAMTCVQWTDRATMTRKGNRPASEDNDRLEQFEGWRNSWKRADSGRHGRFYSYPLSEDKHRGRWSIWWEDSDQPISCFLQGPTGSEPTLVDAFQQHGFLFTEPTPSLPA
ncbi:serine/threonine-protein kinase [Actinoplanes sp. HUAS TT8]|uniref:serine/threonine-protein kinase n=1 Tax=Actinoplanes sp. HUAS TT8 TaxID=3447453 RepID=UPI003F528DBE